MKVEELTKREYIAAMAMQGTITGRWSCPDIETGVDANKIAEEAVQYADSLIKELNKKSVNADVEMARTEKPEHIDTVQDCELAVKVTKEKAIEVFEDILFNMGYDEEDVSVYVQSFKRNWRNNYVRNSRGY